MKLFASLVAALLMLLTAQTASAQSSYPNRPVKILVGFTPGTAPDVAPRILADRFSEIWGTPFVVENIPGAGSNIATDRVAKAAADGHTLLMGGNSSLVINPSLYETLPFDPLRDFAPISQIFIAANVLAIPPELPVKTVAESGFPGFEAVPWFGLLAPSGTPKDVLDKLHGETVRALAMPEVRKKFDELGLEPVGNTPAEFAAIIRKETPEWAKVIRDAGIKLSN